MLIGEVIDCWIIVSWVLRYASQERGTCQSQDGVRRAGRHISWFFALAQVAIQVSNGRGTLEIHAVWLDAEVVFNCGLHALILSAIGRDIEVHFQDLPLGVLLG